MTDIKSKEIIDQLTAGLQLNYIPFYASAFNGQELYDDVEGRVDTQELLVRDLNAGKLNVLDNAILHTKSEYVMDKFYRYITSTKVTKSDFQDSDIQNIANQVLTKMEILRDRIFFNGDGINKGLIRNDVDEAGFYNIVTGTLPTDLSSAVADLKTQLALSADAGNGEKVLIPLGSYSTLLYTVVANTGDLIINKLKETFPEVNFIDGTKIKGLPADVNGYILYDRAGGVLQNTGGQAKIHKIIEGDVHSSTVYIFGSLQAKLTNVNAVILRKVS
jgi:hypothetical protein